MKAAEPIKLRHIECRNRVIRSAVHSFLGATDGHMTDAEYAMYDELAKHGAGMIITGHVCVAKGGRGNPEQINIFADEYKADFTKAAAIAHKYDTRFIVQISHAGPRAIDTDDLADVSARKMKKGREARELSLSEIHATEAAFVTAAERLKDAGADGVQLHAAHSYLLSRFIDPTFNLRTDEYGGSAGNRFRMTENIIRGIKEKCGEDFPVLIKINSDTAADNDAYEKDMVYFLRTAWDAGAELIELSGVDFINQPKKSTLYYLERAKRLRALVGDEIKLSLVGGVRSLADMETVLTSGLDMVSLGRSLIAEPDFIEKSFAGGDNSICVSCSRCFVLPNIHKGVRCMRHLRGRKKQ